MNYAEIETPFEDPAVEGPVFKNVFIIFAHGNELLTKIRKISESMGGTLYPIDSDADRREEALREVSARLEDLHQVLYSTDAARRTEMVKVAESVTAWEEVVRKEKTVYGAMNLCMYDSRRKTLVAEGWCPTSDLGLVQLALRRATERAGTNVPPVLQELQTTKEPPTFHRTNKFTEGFQAIIDAYGFASYQEVNPGLFTVITFPFLFAVMFGDVGHGTLMLLTAAFMCIYEKKLAKAGLGEVSCRGTSSPTISFIPDLFILCSLFQQIFEMFFYGRYIILLMGAFSIFTGFLYNDIFSKSMHLFHTGWEWPHKKGSIEAEKIDHVYPFGLDPTWHGTENSLVFTNSMKMKMSIILGVLHMSFAICLNVPNALHFKKHYQIWAEFIPQMLFMQSLFGYLVITIIYKWSVDWYEQDASGTVFRNNPPGLLNMLIYMFLSPGSVEKEKELYGGQAFIQTVLLLIAAVCVPWMLIAKPYVLYKENQKTQGAGYQQVGTVGEDDDEEEGANGHANGGAAQDDEEGGEHGHGFEIGEVIIHQVIHTIEFCLGCISNTASYLRLWALSLAHAQLSEVLWTMTIQNVFGMTGVLGAIATVCAFAMWFVLTLAILCVMEGLR